MTPSSLLSGELFLHGSSFCISAAAVAATRCPAHSVSCGKTDPLEDKARVGAARESSCGGRICRCCRSFGFVAICYPQLALWAGHLAPLPRLIVSFTIPLESTIMLSRFFVLLALLALMTSSTIAAEPKPGDKAVK